MSKRKAAVSWSDGKNSYLARPHGSHHPGRAFLFAYRHSAGACIERFFATTLPDATTRIGKVQALAAVAFSFKHDAWAN